MSSFERLLCPPSPTTYLHRLSVSGLFIRRILLGFEKLSFTEVSNFAAIFKKYCFDGFEALINFEPEISDQESTSFEPDEKIRPKMMEFIQDFLKVTNADTFLEDKKDKNHRFVQ